ncbi:MAG TPA: class I SAM-dependent methyltransferase [Gammaproteobacteria bacterium]
MGAESWAKDYDATLFAPGSFNAVVWEREQRLLDEVVQRHVARRDSYLDFACGTGRVLAYLERRFRAAAGVDISDTMLAAARDRVAAAELVHGDPTRDPGVLGGRKFDLITAFRFFLNAQPPLREKAMAFLASALRDGASRLVFNVHGNRYSTRAVVAAKARVTGEAFSSMTLRESIALAARHGLEVVEWRGICSYDKWLLRLLPPAAWRRLERTAPLPERFAVNLYFVCRLGRATAGEWGPVARRARGHAGSVPVARSHSIEDEGTAPVDAFAAG